MLKFILILLSVSAFADDDHRKFISCPDVSTIYDGASACPRNCVEIAAPIANMRIMKCNNQNQLVVDDAKKAAHDKKVADEADARDKKQKMISDLEKSTNPEVRALLQLIKEGK